MTSTDDLDVRRADPPDRTTRRYVTSGIVAIVGLLAVVTVVLAVAARRDNTSRASTSGSGVAATERRDVGPFTGVELAGTNLVVVHVGAPVSVTVSGDDNLIGRITTVVDGGRLVVDDTGSFTTKAAMRVDVTTPTLDAVVLGGDGTVAVDGVTGTALHAEVSGTGTVEVTGSAARVTAVLAGDGTVDLHDLAAVDATARLAGTGTIRVNASSTLDATLTGTGTILYRGSPSVTMHDTGTGAVVRE